MTKRASYEQRRVMFEFMQAHEEFARGRLVSPAAVRLKRKLLVELAQVLNAVGTGATKTPEKWFKCWQDWKSDVKAKYARLKRISAETDGGANTAPLTPLEENLLQFFGMDIEEGIPVVQCCPVRVTSEESTGPELPGVVSAPTRLKVKSSQPSQSMGKLHGASECSKTSMSQRRKQRKQKIMKTFGNLLKIEDDKIQVQRDRNNIMTEKNNIADQQVVVLNRLTDVLHGILTHLINK